MTLFDPCQYCSKPADCCVGCPHKRETEKIPEERKERSVKLNERDKLLMAIREYEEYFYTVAKSYSRQRTIAEKSETTTTFLRLTACIGKLLVSTMTEIGKTITIHAEDTITIN